MPCVSGEEEAVDLWAMATELERQFAGYKQRLAERDAGAAAAAIEHVEDASAAAAACDDSGGGEEEKEEDGMSEVMRGRMYEAYVRRRDERLREGWRARMERKEAEVKALWAQLDVTARAAADRAPGGEPAATTTDYAGDERKTEPKDDDKMRRSSDTALAPRRITGKKHARTRNFSSSITTSTTRSDAGRRRAVSQEPPPSSEPQAVVEARKDNDRVGHADGAAAARTTTATARPETSSSLRRKSSVKGQGSAKPKLPRSLPRLASSGGFEALGREVVLPVTGEAALVQSCSSEYAANGETPKVSASPPMQFVVKDNSSDVTGATNTRVSSPELSDPGEVVETVAHGEHEAKDADVEERGEEKKIDASPEELGSPNGEITSDSETEPSYVVYIHKDTSKQEQAMAVSEPLKLAGSDAAMDSDVRTNEEENSEEIMPAPAGSTAVEIATTNAEEAPARESSDESPFSVRSSGLRSARPSCSSIERLLEEDAALLRRKREERAEKKSGGGAPKTPPGSAGSRVSGAAAARSPRETVRGFKRFLSFGKKNRGRDVTVIESTSPSVPSLTDDDSGSGGWQSAGSIKPRMGSSDAASDDTEHGYPVSSPRASCSLQSLVAASPAKSELAEISPQEKSPKAHRSFFSFRSLNCGRG